jgi:hypothetical protein
LAAGALVLAEPRVSAQLIELNGGLSSIYQAEGGTVTLHGRGYQVDVSAGIVTGRAVGGAEVAYNYRHSEIVVGTEQLRLNLPTDLFNDYHRLVGVGAAVRKTTKAGTRLEVFGGETSNRFDTPLFEGIRAEKPAGAFLLEKSLSPRLRLFTQAVYASKLSVIESAAWKPLEGMELGLSAGLGAGAPYGAGSVILKRPQFDLKAGYIGVGSHFARTGSQIDLTPEPVRENVLFTWHSHGDAKLTLTGGRQNFVVVDPAGSTGSASLPDAPSSISTLDQLSGSIRLERIAFTASLLQSSYKGAGNVSFAVAASRTISRELRVQASYFESHPHGPGTATVNRTLVGSAQEVVTSRISANQTATLSNGQTNISFGGSILSNRGTASVDYATYYVPSRPENPFQQALILDVQLNLFGRVTAHAATFMGATGKLLYTADVHASQGLDGAVAPTVVQHVSLGECVLRGRVVDRAGNAVEGAALSIDGKILYSDSDGRFFLRDKKPQVHEYEILLDRFLDGTNWRVVSRPMRMQSTREPRPEVILVVERGAGVAAPAGGEAGPAVAPAPAPAPVVPVPVVPDPPLEKAPPIPFLPEEPAPLLPTLRAPETAPLLPGVAAPSVGELSAAEPLPKAGGSTVPAQRGVFAALRETTSVVRSQPLEAESAPESGTRGEAKRRASGVSGVPGVRAVVRAASWVYAHAVRWGAWEREPSAALR